MGAKSYDCGCCQHDIEVLRRGEENMFDIVNSVIMTMLSAIRYLAVVLVASRRVGAEEVDFVVVGVCECM